jgi:hypothetical protein
MVHVFIHLDWCHVESVQALLQQRVCGTSYGTTFSTKNSDSGQRSIQYNVARDEEYLKTQ